MQSAKKITKTALRQNADILVLFALIAVFFVIAFAILEYLLREILADFSSQQYFRYIITFAIFLLHLLMFSPISFSLSVQIFKSCDGRASNIGDLFYAFSSAKIYFKALFLNLNVFLRIFLRIFVAFLPYVAISILLDEYVITFFDISGNPQALAWLKYTQISLLISAFLRLPFIVLRYIFCKFVLLDNLNLKSRKAIKLGVKTQKKHRFKLYALIFKNLHLLLFCLLIVPILWVYPILKAKFAVLCFNAMRSKKHEKAVSDEAVVFNSQANEQRAINI